MNQVELLALFGTGDVSRYEGIHEGLEVGTPPLSEGVGNLPVAVGSIVCLCVCWAEPLVHAFLEARNLFVFSTEIVAWAGRASVGANSGFQAGEWAKKRAYSLKKAFAI